MEHLLDIKPDIVFLTETWLQSERNVITAEIKEFGYKLYHDIRQEERRKEIGGGFGIMVNPQLTTKQLPIKNFESFEHSIITVQLANSSIYLISVYRLQFIPIATFMTEFTELLDVYMIPNELCIIAGDFNIHYETEKTSAKQFKEILDIYSLQQHIHEPTHIKGHTLDLVITPSVDSLLTNINVTPIDLSHHYLIDFKINLEAHRNIDKIITYRSINKIDNSSLRNDISYQLNSLPEETEFCLKIENYNSTLTKIITEHAPWKTMKVKNAKPPWFDEDYYRIRKLRRQAEKRF